MSRPRRPTPGRIRRRRRAALVPLLAVAAIGLYLALRATVLAPIDTHGIEVSHLTVDSDAVGRKLGVNVLEPGDGGPGRRPLLVFLHGRGGSERTFVNDEAVFAAASALGAEAPLIAFPDGGDHSYWHDRAEGSWADYLLSELIPAVSRRFGADPRRVAIGGISMGGFGAYNLALQHPSRFCAVGGHSPALWFEGGETAPGAFDDAEDFARNDIFGALRRNLDAFDGLPVWNDYGDRDPFRVFDEGFVEAVSAGDGKLEAHSWPGEHDAAYWDRHWDEYLRFYARALGRC